MATPTIKRPMRSAFAAIVLFGFIAAIPPAAPSSPLAVAGVVRALPDNPPPTDPGPDAGTQYETPAADVPAGPSAATARPAAVEVRPEVIAAPPATMVTAELALLDATNRDRDAAGLGHLVPDTDLIPLARTRAAAQIRLPTLSHLDENGALGFLSLIQRAGLPHRVAGENLVRLPGPIDTAPPRAERALMASPTHRANILDPRYGRLAVGLAADTTGRVIFAQLFRDLPP
jgi:uncharacterized protein YkwD